MTPELSAQRYDDFQAGADAENLAVTQEALSMAAAHADDAILGEMLLDAIENDSAFQQAFLAQCRDILEGPYPDGKYHVTGDFKEHIQAIARQRFETLALNRVRDKEYQ